MNATGRRLSWTILLLIGRAFSEPAAPAAPLQLEVVPQAVELSSCDERARLLVIVRNAGQHSASDLAITSFADVPIQLLPDKVAAKSLSAYQQVSWQFDVQCRAAFLTGSLQIILSSRMPASGNGLLSQIVVKSIPVKIRESEPLEKIAAIDVKTTLESLSQSQKGELSVTVTNKTVRPIKASITPTAPSFIEYDPRLKQDLTIQALRAETVTFSVTPKGRIRPGKQLLMLQVQIDTDHGKRDFVVTRELSMGILGESEILKLLGVPSLLLLPGFLAVSTWLLLWRLKVMRPPGSDSQPLEEKSSGFWLISITLSLVISGIFRLQRPDFFSFYDLADLVFVWSASILLGLVVYGLWRAWANWRERSTYPGQKDSPEQVLRKIKQHSGDMAVARVKLKGCKEPAFLLMWHALGGAYVCPRMLLTWEQNAAPSLRETVEKELVEGGDPGNVAQALEPELNKLKEKQPSGVKSFIWDTRDPLNASVHKIIREDIEGTEEREIIVLEVE